MTVDIYITHWVTRNIVEINDLVVDQLFKMRDTTPKDLARTHVVVWTDDLTCLDDLRRRVPSDVDVVMNDRPGRPDAQPSMRNKVLDLSRESGCKAFVLLHNDVRPARGWLELLVDDWREAEKRWGKGSSIVSPRLIPYHWSAPHPESGVRGDSDLWSKRLPAGRDAMTTEQIKAWCARQHSDEVRFRHDAVCCPKSSKIKYDGRELMMFMAGPRFFDAVGGCDESMTGVNYDDTDWAIRAYQAGKRNLQSHGSLIGHVGAFTLNHTTASADRPRADNAQIFITKWGRDLWDEMHAGKLWSRLQRDQRGD
jgi:GT2 family glycosyltransferase